MENRKRMKQLKLAGEGLIGALMVVAAFFTIWLPYWRRWGATDTEIKRALPGDDIVPVLKGGYTHAITINAPRKQVWLWIAQTGQDRGGFYSYDFLENLVGCNIHTVEKIIPGYQHDKKSPGLKMHPKMPPMLVTHLEPESVLAFGGRIDPDTPVSWLFLVEDSGENRTRLVSRWRFSYKPNLGFKIGYGAFLQPIACVMQRKMLLGIKNRAERTFNAQGE
jgi:hypothetical protein